MKRIGIIGAGHFGMALGYILSKNGHEPVFFIHHGKEDVIKNRWHKISLGQRASFTATANHLSTVHGLIVATPAQNVRHALSVVADFKTYPPLLITSKGIERGTHYLMSQVVDDVLPTAHYAILSGPSLADEMMADCPTAAVLASPWPPIDAFWLSVLGHDTFRLYISNDPIGVQMAGALKNVIAIACGVIDGLGLGHNARAAFITRGLREIIRLSLPLGAQSDTFLGLAGIGDLLLTSTTPKSRNYSYGFSLCKTSLVTDTPLVEGLWTAEAACDLADHYKIHAPIFHVVHALCRGHITPREAVDLMLRRPMGSEENL